MAEKKILYVATVVKTHIMQFHLPYLKMMHDKGWHTAVAGRNDYENPADLSIPHCDAYYDIPFDRNPFKTGNLKAYRMLKKVIDEGEYDIVHCHTPVGGILTRLAAREARKRGTKVIYTAHGFHFFKGAPLRNWLIYFPVEWLCAFMTDVLITINKEDFATAKKRMHAKKVVYVPGVGVDLSRFGTNDGDFRKLKQELNIGEDDFVLLSVAELTRNKNHSMILDALAILQNSHIRFISAGRGVCMEELLAKTKKLGLEKTVSFLGYRNDVGALYGLADAFIFPSFREGLSLALMEAMASGLPLIASRIRGNTDLISNGVEGILVDISPSEIAAGIEKLYDNPLLCTQYALAAKEKIQQFSIEKTLEKMDAIYTEVTMK